MAARLTTSRHEPERRRRRKTRWSWLQRNGNYRINASLLGGGGEHFRTVIAVKIFLRKGTTVFRMLNLSGAFKSPQVVWEKNIHVYSTEQQQNNTPKKRHDTTDLHISFVLLYRRECESRDCRSSTGCKRFRKMSDFCFFSLEMQLCFFSISNHLKWITSTSLYTIKSSRKSSPTNWLCLEFNCLQTSKFVQWPSRSSWQKKQNKKISK